MTIRMRLCLAFVNLSTDERFRSPCALCDCSEESGYIATKRNLSCHQRRIQGAHRDETYLDCPMYLSLISIIPRLEQMARTNIRISDLPLHAKPFPMTNKLKDSNTFICQGKPCRSTHAKRNPCSLVSNPDLAAVFRVSIKKRRRKIAQIPWKW